MRAEEAAVVIHDRWLAHASAGGERPELLSVLPAIDAMLMNYRDNLATAVLHRHGFGRALRDLLKPL